MNGDSPLVTRGPVFVAWLLLAPSSVLAACPFDLQSSELQFGAGSECNTPFPTQCETSPVSVTGSRALGGSAWVGTGTADCGTLSLEYTFTLSNGWWGCPPQTNAAIFVPSLTITGGGDSTVNIAVNVEYGGTATGVIPDEYSGRWKVDVLRPDGSIIATVSNLEVLWIPNDPPVTGQSPFLVNVPVGEPFSLVMQANWFPTGPNFGSGQTTEATGFLRLLPSRVLELPPGYTVNEPSGFIRNNRINPAQFKDGFEADAFSCS